MRIALFLVLFLQVSTLSGTYPHIQLLSRECGMFSAFDDVLAVLRCYDLGECTGLKIDFEETGSYYEPTKGPNWWGYYCLPIELKRTSGDYWTLLSGKEQVLTSPGFFENTITRQEAHQLVQKYIRFHESLENRTRQFAKKNFKNCFVVGVHYRGTDKITEAPRVSYEAVREAVVGVVLTRRLHHFKIFVAKDEQPFLDYMRAFFGEMVCYQEGVARSFDSQPMHQTPLTAPYKAGESAVLDCLLLAKCDLLMRTSSNLSRWSTYLNLTLPVIELSQRY